MTTILDYQGERVVLAGRFVIAPTKRTRTLAKLFIRQFATLDTFGIYPLTAESIASEALQKYMGAKVVEIKGPKPKKGRIY
jgi:hypothetical protein